MLVLLLLLVLDSDDLSALSGLSSLFLILLPARVLFPVRQLLFAPPLDGFAQQELDLGVDTAQFLSGPFVELVPQFRADADQERLAHVRFTHLNHPGFQGWHAAFASPMAACRTLFS